MLGSTGACQWHTVLDQALHQTLSGLRPGRLPLFHADLEIAIPEPNDACVVPCCHSGTSLLLEAAALLALASTAISHVAGQSMASKSNDSERPTCQPAET